MNNSVDCLLLEENLASQIPSQIPLSLSSDCFHKSIKSYDGTGHGRHKLATFSFPLICKVFNSSLLKAKFINFTNKVAFLSFQPKSVK